MEAPDDSHMTPDLPPRVGTPDLAGQAGPRSADPPPYRDQPETARGPARRRPPVRPGRAHGKAPRGSVG
ncbi:hypothetical protein [Actinacidiphila epipremni]|uniref:Uncharacterized protein n=1 Tax=Actinacidiphila epipremni TaxID=2053013 RepID=A0ABX0ZVT7_9ACTN|nr:hypothetical protein [Actinacidiphila epipremni]NJP45839.1 hypothetical protein [Actinacidiphila epipremni]